MLLNVIGKGVPGTNSGRERVREINNNNRRKKMIIIIIHGQLIGILMMKIQAST